MWYLNKLAWWWEAKGHWVPVCGAQLTVGRRQIAHYPGSPGSHGWPGVCHPEPWGAPHTGGIGRRGSPPMPLKESTPQKHSDFPDLVPSDTPPPVSVRTGGPRYLSRPPGWVGVVSCTRTRSLSCTLGLDAELISRNGLKGI